MATVMQRVLCWLGHHQWMLDTDCSYVAAIVDYSCFACGHECQDWLEEAPNVIFEEALNQYHSRILQGYRKVEEHGYYD